MGCIYCALGGAQAHVGVPLCCRGWKRGRDADAPRVRRRARSQIKNELPCLHAVSAPLTRSVMNDARSSTGYSQKCVLSPRRNIEKKLRVRSAYLIVTADPASRSPNPRRWTLTPTPWLGCFFAAVAGTSPASGHSARGPTDDARRQHRARDRTPTCRLAGSD